MFFFLVAISPAGRGISRPNVNEIFTDPVDNDAFLWFGGGGVRVAVAGGLSAFADVRIGFQTERECAGVLTKDRRVRVPSD
jgi:hypothetical protein